MSNGYTNNKQMSSKKMYFIIGLCLGHAILFTHYSKAPVSTPIVKDRMTGITQQQHYMDTMLAVLYSNFHALKKRKCDGGSLINIPT